MGQTMGTWLAHMRLAKNILDYGFELDVEPFLIGNIAPDASVDEGAGNLQPPKHITHWYDDNRNIQPEDFYETYLLSGREALSEEQYAFLIGYYAHLVADIEWIAQIWQPMSRLPHWQAVINDPQGDLWTIQKDSEGQDFIYLREHPDNLYLSVLKHVNSVPDYLDYLPQGALTTTVQRICDYYDSEDNQQPGNAKDFPFFTQFDMDSYVECTTTVLVALLHAKEVPCSNPRPLSAYGIRPVA
jgi:hypothetical protein